MRNNYQWIFFLLLLCMTVAEAAAQWIYTNPPSSSRYRNPETSILLKSREQLSPVVRANTDLIQVTGSKSGIYQFTLHLSVDERSIIITPVRKFDYDEEIMISISEGVTDAGGIPLPSLSFSFYTSKMNAYTHPSAMNDNFSYGSYNKEQSSDGRNEKEPGDSPPSFTMTVDSSLAFDGAAFFASKYNLTPQNDKLICILNNDSTFSLSKNVVEDGADFKINKNGYLSYYSPPDNKFYLLDSNYYLLDSFACKNGYETELDNHEFLIFPDGNKYFLISHKEIVDMSQVVAGGSSHALVEFPVIQQQDAAGNVVFEWASWDHFNITDATFDVPLTAATIDPFHTNAIELDTDGNLLISSRYMDEITKIDHTTGNILWRMGGENNQFTFVNDPLTPHFSHQHDIRRLPNGNITLFDNGNLRFPQISYAKEYELDEVNKIATLVWNYKHPLVNNKEVFGLAAGNTQRLANGNTLVNYGLLSNFNVGLPSATEVTPAGEIAWEIRFTENETFSYRMFKFNWSPCSRPTDYTLVATPLSATKEKLSWGTGTGAVKYKVQYRISGTGSWQSVKPVGNMKTLKNLQPETNYEWRIRSICEEGQSPYTNVHTFQTAPLKSYDEENHITKLLLFPNPVKDVLYLRFESIKQQDVECSLRNLQGIIFEQKSLTAAEGTNNFKINLPDLPSGIYFLYLHVDNLLLVEKFAIEY